MQDAKAGTIPAEPLMQALLEQYLKRMSVNRTTLSALFAAGDTDNDGLLDRPQAKAALLCAQPSISDTVLTTIWLEREKVRLTPRPAITPPPPPPVCSKLSKPPSPPFPAKKLSKPPLPRPRAPPLSVSLAFDGCLCLCQWPGIFVCCTTYVIKLMLATCSYCQCAHFPAHNELAS